MTEHVAGQTTAALHQQADAFDSAVHSLDKTLKQNWSPAGREFAINEARAEFEAFTQMQVDAATKHTRDHAAQLETELMDVPRIDYVSMDAIWRQLERMDGSEVDALLRQSDDPQLASAVFHAPAIFPIGSEIARQRLLLNYNRRTRPGRLALLDDARTFMDAISNYRDLLLRKFKSEIR